MTSAELKRLWNIQGKGVACAVNLAIYLKSRERKSRNPLSRKAELKKERLAEKGARRASKKEQRQDVRAACVERAGGYCEGSLEMWPHETWSLEMDHFYGRAFSESVETCWLLCGKCHRAKTTNYPSRGYWDREFQNHCNRHGYPFRPRLTKDIKP